MPTSPLYISECGSEPNPDAGTLRSLPRAGLTSDALPRRGRWLPAWLGFLIGMVPMFVGVAASERLESLASPDGQIRLRVRFPEPASGGLPRWSVGYRGKPLLEGCELGVRVAGEGNLLLGARVVAERRRSIDREVSIPFGRANRGVDRFREARFTLESSAGQNVEVVFRCYDDAVALRYEWSRGGSTEPMVVVEDEVTSFQAVGEPVAHAQYLESYQTSHEHRVTSVPWSAIPPGQLVDLPLTLGWPDGVHVAITEASLRRYAGMALMRAPAAGTGSALVSRLTPRKDGSKVVRVGRVETPWRVVLIGNRPGALLESTTVYCLNDPPVGGDTAWIRPGKITFHWWNGDVYDGRPGPPMLSFEMNQRYIDFCAKEGIPTHSITSTEGVTTPWYWQTAPGVAPGPDTDPTRPREGFELDRIRRYADSKGVRLWTWVHQGALRGRVEECFAAFERQGWTGMMVDFFDHDDQDHVEFAESILEAALRHHLLIQLHGIWKPTGLERTYPNLVNHEGALNLEYLKWSDWCTPRHDVEMAFTRMVAGPMDYHLGGFRAVPRAAFQARQIAPNVLGTRCHMLALYVCFDNPNPMLADHPAAYLGQPGFEFLKQVPTWWDETRVLAGEVGDVLVTARRKGRDWYLGGIAGDRPRELELPLDFLGRGRFRAELWRDVSETDVDPNRLGIGSMELTHRERLKVRMAAGGGFVARMAPQR